MSGGRRAEAGARRGGDAGTVCGPVVCVPTRPLQIAALLLVAGGLMWPVMRRRVQAALLTDSDGCAHAGVLPVPERRAAVLCLLGRQRVAHGLSEPGRVSCRGE